MAANRIIDRHIDARNPRTAQRELVTGARQRPHRVDRRRGRARRLPRRGRRCSTRSAWLLAPLAVVPLVLYPYGKRFTNWPHALLGARADGRPGRRLARRHRRPARLRRRLGARRRRRACGSAASTSSTPARTPTVDREIGVHSVPSRYGIPFALHLSTAAHVVTFGLFVWFGAARRPRLAVVDRPRRHGRRLRLRARHRPPRRPVPGQPRLLHGERVRGDRFVRVRSARPDHPGRPPPLTA